MTALIASCFDNTAQNDLSFVRIFIYFDLIL